MPDTQTLPELRERAGIRQKELAAQLSVTVRHLQYVERGQRKSKSLERRAIAVLRQR